MLSDLIIKNLPTLIEVGIVAITAIAEGIATALPDLVPTIIALVMSICDTILNNLPLVVDAGIEVIVGLLEGIIEATPKLLKYIPILIIKVLNAVGKIVPKLGTLASRMWNALKKPFKSVGEFFGNVRDRIVGKFKSIGTAVGNAISGAFKSAINGALSIVENAINTIPNAVNGVRAAINKLPNVNLPEVPTVKLPRLAQGGIATSATQAIIGEGKHNEAVIPLGDERALNMLKQALGGAGGGTVNQTINVGQMSSYREAYLIKRATEQGLKKMMRATV